MAQMDWRRGLAVGRRVASDQPGAYQSDGRAGTRFAGDQHAPGACGRSSQASLLRLPLVRNALAVVQLRGSGLVVVAGHVNAAREALNFSEWPHDEPGRAARWRRIADAVESGEMPLRQVPPGSIARRASMPDNAGNWRNGPKEEAKRLASAQRRGQSASGKSNATLTRAPSCSRPESSAAQAVGDQGHGAEADVGGVENGVGRRRGRCR